MKVVIENLQFFSRSRRQVRSGASTPQARSSAMRRAYDLDRGQEFRPGLRSKNAMQPLKARVHNGRLVLDEPTDLPEGEVLYLWPAEAVVEEQDDGFDDNERRALHEALDEGIAAARSGDHALTPTLSCKSFSHAGEGPVRWPGSSSGGSARPVVAREPEGCCRPLCSRAGGCAPAAGSLP